MHTMIEVMEEKEVYLSGFSQFEREQGGSAPAWLHALRSSAIDRFAERGFPGPRDEEWRFTPLAPLLQVPFQLALARPLAAAAAVLERCGFDTGEGHRLVFLNGQFSPELSRLRDLPRSVFAGNLTAALQQHPEPVKTYLAKQARFDDLPFAALNTAFLRDGAVVIVPKDAVVAEPIHLVFVAVGDGEPAVSYPRSLILAGVNSQATLVQSYVGAADTVYLTNAVTEIVADEGALVDHYKLQRESRKAFHLEATQLRLGRSSKVASSSITLGGGWVRNEVGAVLAGEGGECTLNGLYFGGDNQLIDNHTVIDHAMPHCASHELYKGILDGKARGVFNGKIFVRQDAQKTDAKQTNKTLLLSDDATINTKPQLEIYADDVKCTHGATVGQLSAEAIFYLRARGIGLAEARGLLTYAFANDVIGKIQVEPLRRQLEHSLLSTRQLQALPSEEDSVGREEAP
jgi:Fe-S cluster assembly protein SufD